jgi:predicted hydrocarbon binding protein
MPFRLDRFLAAVESLTDEKVAKKIMHACDHHPAKPASPVKKGALVRCLIEELHKKTSKNCAQTIMENCGRMCIGKSTLKRAMELKKTANDLDEFLNKLNKQGIGGGYLQRKGKQIIARYDRCYCGWVSKSKDPIPLTYCFCSAGWYKELFEKSLGRSANVTVIQSIISGAKTCRFIIDL